MSDRPALAPLVDVDPYGSVRRHKGWRPAYTAQPNYYSDLSAPSGCRSFCVGWLNLNKLNYWHQGGGSWFNDGAKIALAAFDYELST